MRTPLRGLLGLLLLAGCRETPTGPSVGNLDIVVSGVPGAAPVEITVTSAAGFSQVVTTTETLTGIPAGRYTLTAAPATVGEDIFSGPAPFEVRLRRGRSAEAIVPFVLASGTLTFVASGLPDGTTSVATLSGPGNRQREVPIPGQARGLIAGEWSVRIATASGEGHGWAAAAVGDVSVPASATPVEVPVTFSLATGSLDLSFLGLPVGVGRQAVIYGAIEGTSRRIDTVTVDGVSTGWAPGVTSIIPLPAADVDIQYQAPSATVTVEIGLTPLAVAFDYTPRTGRIAVSSTGLPGGLEGKVRVTGPAGYNVLVSASDTLRGVPNGTYQVKGVLVADALAAYSAPGTSVVVVTGAATSDAVIAFAPDPTLNLAVENAYLVQSVQNVAGDVPLLAGRGALLRVFAVASADNGFEVPVRARLLDGGIPVFDTLLAANAQGVPTVTDQGTFTRSWNVAVPGALVQPGRTLEVVIDPDEVLPEANRGDNTWSSAPLDVRTLPPFRARFVPVQFATGRIGGVTLANGETFLAPTRAMHPVDSIDWDLRAPYVTTHAFMTSSISGIWSSVLSEVHLLRVTEGSDRYYMGVIPVGYTSGIAGIGYLGAPTSLSWDYLPSGAGTLAHELGHNFDRRHAPCGGPAGVDPSYPYPGAAIGAFGYEASTGSIKPPTTVDLMSYCSDEWISDYTYRGVIEYRQATEVLLQAGSVGNALVVSGRIVGGRVELNPVYTLVTRAALPEAGPHRLEFVDAGGRTLYAAGFAAARVADDGTDDEHFAFAIPVAALGGGDPSRLAVEARGARAELRRPAAAALRADAHAVATREPDSTVTVAWSDPAARGMIVRDAATGRIISIVRGTSVRLPAGIGEVEVLASDGLRTRIGRARPQPF